MSKDNREMNIEEKYMKWFDVAWNGYDNPTSKESFKAGYELAQKEMQEKLDAAIEVIKFYAYEWEQDQSVFGGYGTYMTSLKNDTEEICKNTRSYGKLARDFLKARGE